MSANANSIPKTPKRIVSKLSQNCLKIVSWEMAPEMPPKMPLKVGGPPARNFIFQWADRDHRDHRDHREMASHAAAPGHWPVRRQCFRAWPLACAKAMLPLLATGPCEARKPIPGAKHLPGTIPVVSVVPAVPVAGPSPAKRPRAYLDHRPVAMPSASRLPRPPARCHAIGLAPTPATGKSPGHQPNQQMVSTPYAANRRSPVTTGSPFDSAMAMIARSAGSRWWSGNWADLTRVA